ncbi:hypothetical protein, partial [Deinococcus sp. Leaf326]|uniref:hypothetical protein n=1 Tax=Deinococcus sp. Leaf326 TaxID=1736338 RepID=UPI000A9C425A
LHSISFELSGMDSAGRHEGASYRGGLSPSAQNRVNLRFRVVVLYRTGRVLTEGLEADAARAALLTEAVPHSEV